MDCAIEVLSRASCSACIAQQYFKKNTDSAQLVCFLILQEENGKGRQEKFTTFLLP